MKEEPETTEQPPVQAPVETLDPIPGLWSANQSRDTAAVQRSGRIRLAILVGLSLAMAGAFSGLISWAGKVQTPLLFAIMVTEHSDPGIIPVAFGWEDLQLLTSGKVFDRVHPVPESSLDREQIRILLGRLQTVARSEQIVVYLCAKASVGADGNTKILPSNARFGSSGDNTGILEGMGLPEIFSAVRDSPARQKLLILDIFQPLVNVPTGNINFDLPQRVLNEFDEFKRGQTESPFHLLLSCQPGQRASYNQELKHSLFCHYFSLALQGKIPVPPNSRVARLGRVYLNDLTDIINPYIDRWASENTLERQFCMLVPGVGDMILGVPKQSFVTGRIVNDLMAKVEEEVSVGKAKKAIEAVVGRENPAEEKEKDSKGKLEGDSKDKAGSGTARETNPSKDAKAESAEGKKDGKAESEKPESPVVADGKSIPVSGPANSMEREIPREVLDTWSQLQAWMEDGRSDDNPRLMTKLATLARTSTIYHVAGLDPSRYVPEVQFRLQQIRAAMDATTNRLVEPGAYPSIGMLPRSILKTDCTAEATELIRMVSALRPIPGPKIEREQAAIKILADFLKANPGLNTESVECCIVRAATLIPDLQGDQLSLLGLILRSHHSELRTVEARLLSRLSLKTEQPGFDIDLYRICLQVSLNVNRAAAKWQAYRFISTLMEQMSEECMAGLWLAENSPAEHGNQAKDHLSVASRLAVYVEGFNQTLADARQYIWLTMQDLLAFESYPASMPPGWEEYAGQLAKVLDAIETFPTGQKLTLNNAEDAVRKLRLAVRDLSSVYETIHQAAGPNGIAEFERLVGADRISPATLIELSSVVRLGGIPKSTRLHLLEIRADLIRKIAKNTLAQEKLEFESWTPAPARPAFDPTDLDWSYWRGEPELERLRLGRLLLGILDLNPEKLASIDLLIRKVGPHGSPGSDVWPQLAQAFRRAYLKEIPDMLSQGKGWPFVINIAYPGWLDLPILDDPDKNPALISRNKERLDHLSWQVSRFRHESRVGNDQVFMAEKASLLGGKFNITPPTGIRVISPAPLFFPENQEILEATVPWFVEGLGVKNPKFGLLPGSEGPFLARIDSSTKSPSGGTVKVSIRRNPKFNGTLSLKTTSFVIEIREDDRVWFGKVEILPEDDGSRPQILLFDGPDSKNLVGDEIHLRGSGSKTIIFSQIRQNSGKPANLTATVANPNSPGWILGPIGLSLPSGVAIPLGLDLFNASQNSEPSNPNGPNKGQPVSSASPGHYLTLPGKLLIDIRDPSKTEKSPVSRAISIKRVDPNDLLELVSASTDSDPFKPVSTQTCQVRVTVRAKRPPLTGPPCRVDLVLDKDSIAIGLTPPTGNVTGILPPDGAPLTLEAMGVVAAESSLGIGQFTLSVDGLPMTFRFKGDFKPLGEKNNSELVRQPVLGLKAVAAASTGQDSQGVPNAPQNHLNIEAWASPAPGGSTLRLTLLGGNNFTNVEKVENLPGPYLSRVQVKPAKAGAWEFSCDEGSWKVAWLTEGLRGKKKVRLELLDLEGNPLATKETSILLDPTPPRFGEVIGLPEKLNPGTMNRFIVNVQDLESGITSVTGFFGIPVPNPVPGTPPLPAASLIPVTKVGATYEAALEVPSDAKGTVTFTFRAINGAGLETLWTKTLPVSDIKPPQPPSIRGRVTEGTRPQKGLQVVLKDDKGKEIQKVQTDENGDYRFDNLKPGKGTLEVIKNTSGRSAKKPVVLDPGPPLQVDLNLLQ